MRARTIREGSVGLLIFLGLGIFLFLVAWLRGFRVGAQSYTLVIAFDNTLGMQAGAQVRYRGVPVGKVLMIRPMAAQVEVEVEIERVDLHIPKDDLIIEANQSGFLGEASIDMYPDFREPMNPSLVTVNPLEPGCDSMVQICADDRLQGELGVSFEKLIRSTAELSDQLTDPELFNNVKDLTANSANAAQEAARLSSEVTELVQLFQAELGPLSASTQGVANSFARAADEFSLTAAESREFLNVNRTALIATLDNVEATSRQIRLVAEELAPMIQQGDLIADLGALTENAAIASANLRDLSTELNDPATILMLQQTLESARSTFQNVQKITADLDELTGDAEFREDIRRLIQGFSGLVSTTTDLNQQTAWVNEAIVPTQLSLETVAWTPLDLSALNARPMANAALDAAQLVPGIPVSSSQSSAAAIALEPIWADLDPQTLLIPPPTTGENANTVVLQTPDGQVIEVYIPTRETLAEVRSVQP